MGNKSVANEAPRASPAITMENSPRGVRNAPMRNQLIGSDISFAIIRAKINLPAIPITAKSSAIGSTPGISPGSVIKPKNKKNKAAKKSRRGESLARAASATSPDNNNPTKNAAIAPDIPAISARPAANKAAPKTVSRSPVAFCVFKKFDR